MIFQVIDPFEDRLRLWTSSASSALQCQDDLEREGRTTSVADYKGCRLSASDLYEWAAKENERLAAANLVAFKRLMDTRKA